MSSAFPSSRKVTFVVRVGAACAAVLLAASAHAQLPDKTKVETVKCARGETIAKALLTGDADSHALLIHVIGTCHENVTITRDDVTLRGDGAASSRIVGVHEANLIEESPVTISGAQRVEIEGLGISGGTSSGIAATGARFTVRNSVIESNGYHGVFVGMGSYGRIYDNLVRANSIDGILVFGGRADILGNTVENNARHGVQVRDGGSAGIGRGLAGTTGPNVIRGNQGSGVAVVGAGQADVEGNTIENNGENGVISHLGGSVSLAGNTIGGGPNGSGVFVNEGASARIEAGNTIESAAAGFFSGAAVSVYRNASLRVRGAGNTIRNVTPTGTPSGPCDSNNRAFAIDVEMNGTFRQDTGRATIEGAVYSYNLSTVDVRNAEITGNVFSDGLDANVRLRPNTGDDVTVNGDICLASKINIRPSAVVNGNIYCNGNPSLLLAPFPQFQCAN